MSDIKTLNNSSKKPVRPVESVEPASDPAACNETEGLSRLLGVMAHEIKNPLSTIKVNLRLIDEQLQDIPAGSDELSQSLSRTRRKIAVIEKETSRLQQILDSFLRYANRTEPQFATVDLNSLVGDLIDFYSPQALAHSINLRYQLHGGPILCRVDSAMLKQAVLNLFLNAQQAIGVNGDLMVRTACDGKSAKIHISDTGKGIPADRIAHIFEPYQSTRPNGTGLGLATTKKIVEAHNGSITVHSEPGKGTSFTITIPLADSRTEVSK